MRVDDIEVSNLVRERGKVYRARAHDKHTGPVPALGRFPPPEQKDEPDHRCGQPEVQEVQFADGGTNSADVVACLAKCRA